MSDNAGKPLRKTMRLRGYDYSSAGAYFITITAKDRRCVFGNIFENRIVLNIPGIMVQDIWKQLPDFYPLIILDEFIVMPNHIHGILFLEENEHDMSSVLDVGAGYYAYSQVKLTIPEIVQRFKTTTTNKYIDGVRKYNWTPFEDRLWQRGYYDRVIRDEAELLQTREYIRHNVASWNTDRVFVDQT